MIFFGFFIQLYNFDQVYIDKPTNIQECYPKIKFQIQVFQNYKQLYAQLLRGVPKKCDFSAYKKFVRKLEDRTLAIIEAYFSCTEYDCTPAITAASEKCLDYSTTTFHPLTKCSFTNFSPDCAQVLIQAQTPTYVSAQNIITSLLICAKLKSEAFRRGDGDTHSAIESFQLLLQELNGTKGGVPECNCVKIVNSILY